MTNQDKIIDILQKNEEIISNLNNRVKTLEKLIYKVIMTDGVGYSTREVIYKKGDRINEPFTTNDSYYDNFAELLLNYLSEKKVDEFENDMIDLEKEIDLKDDERAFA